MRRSSEDPERRTSGRGRGAKAAALPSLGALVVVGALAWPVGDAPHRPLALFERPHGGAVEAGATALDRRATPPEAHTRDTVEIRGFEFVPKILEVSVGDTVVWVNRDAVPHTATAPDTAWDSGMLAGDSTWSMVVEEPGDIPYLCIYHPNMTGELVVE